MDGATDTDFVSDVIGLVMDNQRSPNLRSFVDQFLMLLFYKPFKTAGFLSYDYPSRPSFG